MDVLEVWLKEIRLYFMVQSLGIQILNFFIKIVNEVVVLLNCLEDIVVDAIVMVTQTHNLLSVDFLAGDDMAEEFIEDTIFDKQEIVEL